MPNDMLPADQDNTELLKQQDQHQYEIAKLNIEKNCENNAMWAAHWFKMRMLSLVFIAFFIIVVLAFCGIAMWLDHAEIAIRIIEGFIIFAAGNGTGYAVKTHLVKQQESQRQQ